MPIEIVEPSDLDHFITPGELFLLLSLTFLPVFLLAMYPQARVLARCSHRVTWLSSILVSETILAFLIWISPLSRHFLPLEFLPSEFFYLAIPLQAAIVAATVVTVLSWLLVRSAGRATG